ncbi:chemotaxis protein CheD [Proteinivorax hydrogeniformans]|uniref:Probable chemoreceptor glutamine deamidase CheD n=1 Tax=Proteinivorax hydrogeniformans TaxID=1826727 RepID=A0AAU8HNZ7_9FIRM
MTDVLKVGMSEVKITSAPTMLKTTGLGSCIGLCMYDEKLKIGGMAHVMLPSSVNSKVSEFGAGKYADTAVEFLIKSLKAKGCKKLKAKIAGGAQMFTFSGGSDIMKVGARNVKAVKELLAEQNINIISEDTGGNKGRTIVFDTDNFHLIIRTIGSDQKTI